MLALEALVQTDAMAGPPEAISQLDVLDGWVREAHGVEAAYAEKH